jgi:hypothetical protein
MLLRQLALVSEASSISFSEVSNASAAIQKQITRDFSPIWDVKATMDAFAKLEDIPIGYWPVMIRDDIGQSGALGIHLDKDNQPFALVTAGDNWPLTASHESMEMLADPFGNRLMAGDSPKSDQGRVEFLVEVCDPSEAADFGYTVNGIVLSDFYTPSYFDPVQAAGVRYSFTGAITEPREVLKGGYLSWHDPVSDDWWQLVFFGDQPTFRNIGRLTQKGESLRAQIDRITNPETLKAMAGTRATLMAASAYTKLVAQSSVSKAHAWREQIEQLKGGSAQEAKQPVSAQPTIRRAPRKGKRGV